MAIVWFSGAESSNIKEFPVTSGTPVADQAVHTGPGICSMRSTWAAAQFEESASGLALTTAYIGCWVYTNAAGANGSQLFLEARTASALIADIRLGRAAGGLSFTCENDVTSATVGSAVTGIQPNTWYQIEMRIVISATVGHIEFKLNGVVVAGDQTTNLNTGSTAVDRARFGTSGTIASGTGNIWVDDMWIDGASYNDGAYVIDRTIFGTQTAAANWTVTGTADGFISEAWGQAPPDTSLFCTTGTASAAQSATVNSYATIQATVGGQTARGTGLIGSLDTVLAVKSWMYGRTANATTDSADSLRRIVGGVTTDVAVTAWATTAAPGDYREVLWASVPSQSDLDSHSIGVVHGGTGTRVHTIYDMGTSVLYTPANIGVAPFKHAARRIAQAHPRRSYLRHPATAGAALVLLFAPVPKRPHNRQIQLRMAKIRKAIYKRITAAGGAIGSGIEAIVQWRRRGGY